jgi:RHS repeat-associated protein
MREGATSPVGWQSKPLDPALGLYFNHARFYSAGLGRFTQASPLGAAFEHLYGYGANSPAFFADFNGLAYGIGEGKGGFLGWIGGLELPGPGGRSNEYWNEHHSWWDLYNWGDPLSFSGAERGRGRHYGRVAYGVGIGATAGVCVLGGAEILAGARPLPPPPTPPTSSDQIWDRKAPPQVEPGTPPHDRFRYNPSTGKHERSTVEYDQFGRQAGRTDWTDHDRPQDHPNPHHHTREYGPGRESGQEFGPYPGHERWR